MNWTTLVAEPSLQNLPYKIETNHFGQIVMSPATVSHSFYQGRIGHLMENLRPDGITLPECPIETFGGVKVADVAWCSSDFIAENELGTSFQNAPEICVEMISPANSKQEMIEKCALYFERGASEVWTCTLKGKMVFYNVEGEIRKSKLFPTFPNKIEHPIFRAKK